MLLGDSQDWASWKDESFVKQCRDIRVISFPLKPRKQKVFLRSHVNLIFLLGSHIHFGELLTLDFVWLTFDGLVQENMHTHHIPDASCFQEYPIIFMYNIFV